MKSPRLLLVAIVASTTLTLVLSAPAVGQDPAVVNAKTLRVTLENDRVRVLEAVLEPGAKEQLHNHPAYVFYVLDGGTMRNHLADGTTRDSKLEAGQVFFREPLTHWAENIGSTTVRVLLVELKESPPAAK